MNTGERGLQYAKDWVSRELYPESSYENLIKYSSHMIIMRIQ